MKNVYSYSRWSSDAQTEGDSERRQLQGALNWCQKRGLTLSSRTFIDRGVSAWKGKNRKDGALAALIKQAKSGDTVLIEDNDRFSREDPITAMAHLREFVSKGVTVCFIKTGVEVTAENFNDPNVLIPNFFASYLGNAEDRKKSFRIREIWAEKKKKIVTERKAVSHKLPFWLNWDKQAGKPVVNRERIAVVRRMFELCLEGLGVVGIALKLNAEGHPPCGRHGGKSWYSSIVYGTLINKAVLGFCCFVEPIVPGIYPAIVDETTFYRVQKQLTKRRGQTVRTRSKHLNLFTGLGRCSQCGGSLIWHRQNKTRNGRKLSYDYLVCSAAKQGMSVCSIVAVGYKLMEDSFLALLQEGDLIRGLLGGKTEDKSKLGLLRMKLEEADRQCEKINRLIVDQEDPPRSLMTTLTGWDSKAEKLRGELMEEEAAVKASRPVLDSYELLTVDLSLEGSDRIRLKEGLRDVVDRVVVDTRKKEYQVFFRDASEPVTVILGPSGWSFCPAPRHVLGNGK